VIDQDIIDSSIAKALEGEGMFYDKSTGDWYANLTAAVAKEAFAVGGDGSNNISDYVFYATATPTEGDPFVQIGSWRASNLALHSTLLDKNNDPYVYLSGGGSLTGKFNNQEVDQIIFKAGEKFGVTANGELYAMAGKIGGITIGNFASKDDIDNIEIGGVNLMTNTLLGSDKTEISTQIANRFTALYGYAYESNSSSVTVKTSEILNLKTNQQYTLSFVCSSRLAKSYSIAWDLWVHPDDGDEKFLP
jgi:hypothetical protein